MKRLEQHISRAEAAKAFRERDLRVANYAIELQTAFALLARTVYLAGATGGRSAAGTVFRSCPHSRRTAALHDAARLFRKSPAQVPGRDEPSWQSFNILGRIAAQQAIGNASDITAAVSMYPATGTVVTSVRNFYAHRTQYTYEKVRDYFRTHYAYPLRNHLTDSVLTVAPGRPSSFAWEWVGHYRNIAEVLCGT